MEPPPADDATGQTGQGTLVSLRELAAIYGVCRKTIGRWIRKGWLCGNPERDSGLRRYGRLWRVDLAVFRRAHPFGFGTQMDFTFGRRPQPGITLDLLERAKAITSKPRKPRKSPAPPRRHDTKRQVKGAP